MKKKKSKNKMKKKKWKNSDYFEKQLLVLSLKKLILKLLKKISIFESSSKEKKKF